ncbi:acetylornithine deacetylase [Martelella lutilitoris]|uniref:Acetylornithine deacetylase n=1 Tax=Martelella lutilitoris TaxID=2583532 RepID=A0A5C4JV61_9HYPH|nr:acetylornithine deacetylase [Martelella lutilitoris]TNB48529.1 acetylornithine deacetylase [Martelella lutilitoris]
MAIDRVCEILERLIAFPTISSASNLDLVAWVEAFLEEAGFSVTRIPSACGNKAGLLARFGEGEGGALLSAHTDVVPVEGQAWSRDPFKLHEENGRLYGRGATDMKGFIACVLALAETSRERQPKRPVMIALSFDEEVGCRGIPQMIDHVIPTLGRPDFAIVGEPTLMRPAIGHKGKASYHAVCHGTPGHSAMAPKFQNALHLAADLIMALRAEQARLMAEGARDRECDPPCSTVHAGILRGGKALNIVPDRADVDFEIRHLAAETPGDILGSVRAGLPDGIEITETGAYPGLDTDPQDPALRPVMEALDEAVPLKLAFGTEAGFFSHLGLPTVVCGPGTMDDGHQPDESIAIDQLVACLAFLKRISGAQP